MTVRVILLAHAASVGQRQALFGDRTGLQHPELVEAWPERVAAWIRAPEPACRETAERLGGTPQVEERLAGLHTGRWAGRALDEVGATEPDALVVWLSDPDAAPHGGESLRDLVVRVGRFLDDHDWPQGRSVAVVTPLVARAAAVHALAADAGTVFRVDVPPLGRVQLSGGAGSWRLSLR